MIEDLCLEAFARLGNTSFARLPLRLPPPASGRSWTLAWLAANGAFVRAGQVLLEVRSDGDGQSLRLPSLLPGRLHIRVADSRFVPCTTTVGELEFGTALQLPAPTHPMAEANRVRQDAARLHALKQRLTRLRQAIPTLIREIGALRSKRRQLLALQAKQRAASRPDLADCETADLLADALGRLELFLSRCKKSISIINKL